MRRREFFAIPLDSRARLRLRVAWLPRKAPAFTNFLERRKLACAFQFARGEAFLSFPQREPKRLTRSGHFRIGTFRTCRVAIAMSVGGGKADLAHGRIGAFLSRPWSSHSRDKDGI
jgi:hypothetical protein